MHRVGIITIIMIVICAGLIQVAALGYVEIAGIKPDILLLVVIFIALSCQQPETIKAAIIAGVIKDMASSSVFGSYMLAFLVLGLLLNYNQRRFYSERPLTQMLFGFCSYLFVAIFILGIKAIAHRGLGLFYIYLNIAFKGALYTGAVSPMVFFAASRMSRVRFIHAV